MFSRIFDVSITNIERYNIFKVSVGQRKFPGKINNSALLAGQNHPTQYHLLMLIVVI